MFTVGMKGKRLESGEEAGRSGSGAEALMCGADEHQAPRHSAALVNASAASQHRHHCGLSSQLWDGSNSCCFSVSVASGCVGWKLRRVSDLGLSDLSRDVLFGKTCRLSEHVCYVVCRFGLCESQELWSVSEGKSKGSSRHLDY